MRKLPNTRLELLVEALECLENYANEYNQDCIKAFDDGYDCDFSVRTARKRIIRLARIVNMTNWNFNCFEGDMNVDVYEDFNILKDEIKSQYVYECERRGAIKYQWLIDMAKYEAEKLQDTEALTELAEVTPAGVITDNGARFKRFLSTKGYDVILDLYERTITGVMSAII